MKTYRDLLESMIHEMSDEELRDFILYNDFKNMAVFDNTLKGNTPKEKILELLKMEVEESRIKYSI